MVNSSFESNIKNSFSRAKDHIKLLEREMRANREFIIQQNEQIKFLLEELSLKTKEKSSNLAKLAPKEESSTGNEGVYADIHSFNIHSFNSYSTDIQYSDVIHSFNNMGNMEIKEAKIDASPEYFGKIDDVVEANEKKEQAEIKEISNNLMNTYLKGISKISLPLEVPGTLLIEGSNKKPELNIFDLKRREVQQKKPFASFQGFRKEVENLFDNFTKQELLTFLTIYQLEDEINNVSYIDIAKKISLSEGCVRTYISSLIRKGAPIEKNRYNNKLVLLAITKGFRELNLKKQLMAIYYRSDPYQPTLKEDF